MYVSTNIFTPIRKGETMKVDDIELELKIEATNNTLTAEEWEAIDNSPEKIKFREKLQAIIDKIADRKPEDESK